MAQRFGNAPPPLSGIQNAPPQNSDQRIQNSQMKINQLTDESSSFIECIVAFSR